MSNTTTGVVVLAAGKGTRLGCTDIPKVMLDLGGKPIVAYTVETLEAMGFSSDRIVLVVGFQKESVMEYFGDRVTYAVQAEQKGTAHAAYVGMQALPREVTHALVLGGDDSAFYSAAALDEFITSCVEGDQTLCLLSAHVEDPSQLGRVVRYATGAVEVIEKEYVTPEQAKINEISTGTFCFDRQWFESIFPNMPELRKLGEYGLPTALAMARAQGKNYSIVPLSDATEWFGVNTPEQLEEARRRKSE